MGSGRVGVVEPHGHVLRGGDAVVVRSATPADAPQVVDLFHAVVQEGPYTLAEPGDPPLSVDEEGAAIRAHAADAADLYLVAEADGVTVGWLAFERGRLRRTAHRGEFSLFVHADWRDRGVGTALLCTLLTWAAAHPTLEKVALAVFATNTRAIALYERLGFVAEGRCPRDMKLADGTYIDSILMYRFV
jgi:L-amino acid N-acyltransferase YncA